MRHSLYKYYSERRWAEAFLGGDILFRSLSYFSDYEDAVRGDPNEGTAIFRPEGGLVGYNDTQRRPFVLPNHAFESTVNKEEIFVFCASRSLTDELRTKFDAVVCVEILEIRTFCDRITAALPSAARFARRLGRRVEYYEETEGGTPRWALPDLIATSKLDKYAWQREYRLVFSLTDALGFEKVETRLTTHRVTNDAKAAGHREYTVKAGSLRDICRLHEF